MENYPKTLLEFAEQFSTEEACFKYLFNLRWPKGFICNRCNGKKAWITKQGLYKCACCGYKISVIKDTIFQDTKKPLRLWYWAIWLLTSQKYGTNAKGLQRVLDIKSYQNAWIIMHKLRHAMVRAGRDRLSGTVQIDEVYIGGKKSGKRGRGAEGKALVVIMTELKNDKIARIRLKQVVNASGPELEKAITESVKEGSTIQTDGWEGYRGLSDLEYKHDVIRKDSDIGENTLPKVNRIAALLKRWLLGTYQGRVEQGHLDSYLDEYTFRFNRRTSRSRGLLFYRLLEQCVAVSPLTRNEIISG